jgi:hypothetical protein
VNIAADVLWMIVVIHFVVAVVKASMKNTIKSVVYVVANKKTIIGSTVTFVITVQRRKKKMNNILNILELCKTEKNFVRITITKELCKDFTEEQFTKLKYELLKAGATEDSQINHLSGDRYYQNFILEGVQFSLDFHRMPSKEDKIAQLKKELAKLEAE